MFDFKKYRSEKNLTQEEAGQLLGLSGQYWSDLELGKIPPKKANAFARVLRFTGNPKLDIQINRERLESIKEFGVSFSQASHAIGSGHSTYSNLIHGSLAVTRRWQLVVNALFLELEEKKNQPQMDLQPDGEIVTLVPQIVTATEPETDSTASGLVPFVYQSIQVRCKMMENAPWFMLADICRAIGYPRTDRAISLVRERDWQNLPVIDSIGREQTAYFISEPGLYQLLTRARVDGVVPFQNWLFDEVLPTLRKTGAYQIHPQAPKDPLGQVAMIGQALMTLSHEMQQQRRELAAASARVEQLERNKVDPDRIANQALLRIQGLESKRRELQNLVYQTVAAARESNHILAGSYKSYKSVWHAVFDASNPPVNKLAGYTTLAQINTGIDAAQQLLGTFRKPGAKQIAIDLTGGKNEQ